MRAGGAFSHAGRRRESSLPVQAVSPWLLSLAAPGHNSSGCHGHAVLQCIGRVLQGQPHKSSGCSYSVLLPAPGTTLAGSSASAAGHKPAGAGRLHAEAASSHSHVGWQQGCRPLAVHCVGAA